MTTPVLPSTFLLTLLLMVGLFFFIRASTKDRTETLKLSSPQPPEALQAALQQYFQARSYEPVANAPEDPVRLAGFVRPSLFLAFFLSFLAAIGAACLALVLAILWPQYSYGFAGLLLIAPLAGRFYWQRAARVEEVAYQVTAAPVQGSQVQVTAHRDELIALRQALPLKAEE